MPDTEDFYTDIIDNPKFVELLFEEYELDTILYFLDIADYRYHENDDPIITDKQYDAIIRLVEIIDPTNKRFIKVGSNVRGGKVKLPYPMGSLNQKYEKDIQEWVTSKNLSNKSFIVTDKLDGISCLLIYDNTGKFQNGYSRGNGLSGQLLTLHLNNINTIPKNITNDIKSVRGELIISKSNWKNINQKSKTKSGNNYKNSRNCVAGLMNSITPHDQEIYNLISFVSYEIVDFYEKDN